MSPQADPDGAYEGNDLLDLLPDAVIGQNGQRRVSFWNRAAEVAYGFSAAEAIGTDPVELLRARLPLPLTELSQTLADTGRWQGQVLVRRKDGTRLTVQSRWAATYDRAGAMTGSVWVDRDAGSLTGAVAHDLNNLLAIIINYGAIVAAELRDERRSGRPESQRSLLEHLGEIEDAALRAGRLTQQLLELPGQEPPAPPSLAGARARSLAQAR